MSEVSLPRADSNGSLSVPSIPPPRISPRAGSPKTVVRAQSNLPAPPAHLLDTPIRRDSNTSLADSHDERSLDTDRSLTDDSNLSDSEMIDSKQRHKGSISISLGPTPIISAKGRANSKPKKAAAASPKVSDLKKQRPQMTRSGEIKVAKQAASSKSATLRAGTLRKHSSKDLTEGGKIKKLTKSTLAVAVEIPKETRTAWEQKLETEFADQLRTKLEYNKQIDDLHYQEELGKLILPTVQDITSKATTVEQLQLKYLLVFLDTTDPITSNTIFRKKGKPAEVKKLRKDLDKLVADYEKEHREEKEKKDKKEKKDVGMRTKEITSAGELLKELLKSMPDPLVPPEYYFDALAAHGLEMALKLAYVRDLIRTMNEDRRLVLQMLLVYLGRLSENSIKNEFTLDEISQVFCPYIIADKNSFEQTKSAEESVPSTEEAVKLMNRIFSQVLTSAIRPLVRTTETRMAPIITPTARPATSAMVPVSSQPISFFSVENPSIIKQFCAGKNKKQRKVLKKYRKKEGKKVNMRRI